MSVGAVLYEIAVGRPPFRAANHVELLKRIDHSKGVRFPDEDPVNAVNANGSGDKAGSRERVDGRDKDSQNNGRDREKEKKRKEEKKRSRSRTNPNQRISRNSCAAC